MMWFRSRKLLFGGGEFCHEGVNFLVADGDAAFAKDFGNFRSEFASLAGAKSNAEAQPTIAPPRNAEINVSALIFLLF